MAAVVSGGFDYQTSNYAGCLGALQATCNRSTTNIAGVFFWGHGNALPYTPGAAAVEGPVLRIARVRDGTSNTFCIGEATEQIGGWVDGYYRDYNNASTYRECRGPMNSMWHPRGMLFGSNHEGGAFFLFLDGQVRFLSENIDHTTYKSLCSYDGNEIIDDEDY